VLSEHRKSCVATQSVKRGRFTANLDKCLSKMCDSTMRVKGLTAVEINRQLLEGYGTRPMAWKQVSIVLITAGEMLTTSCDPADTSNTDGNVCREEVLTGED
jgi:hypothetical protein